MTEKAPYSPQVLAHFANPAHAGSLGRRYPVEAVGAGVDAASGCRVVLAAGIRQQILCEMRFRVYGCPHLVAAAEEWCRQAEGQPVGGANAPSVAGIMAILDVPAEKTGRMLALEDAWQALLKMQSGEPIMESMRATT